MRTTHHDRHRCAQNADHLTHNRTFSAFFAEVVCTLGTIPPQTVISPSPNGGNGVIRDPTRRRHAASQFLMLQNPHRRREGTRATGVPPDARPDCGTCGGRARPRCPWATAGPGCGAYGQQRHYRLPNFARNLSWSFFETPQKHCNSNDANSMFEQAAGELRAKLMGGGGA